MFKKNRFVNGEDYLHGAGDDEHCMSTKIFVNFH